MVCSRLIRNPRASLVSPGASIIIRTRSEGSVASPASLASGELAVLPDPDETACLSSDNELVATGELADFSELELVATDLGFAKVVFFKLEMSLFEVEFAAFLTLKFDAT